MTKRPYSDGNWFLTGTPHYLDGGQSGPHHGHTLTIRSSNHTEELATIWTYLLPTRANARLMCAAPRLVDALEALLKERTPNTRERARAILEEVTGPIEEFQRPPNPHTSVPGVSFPDSEVRAKQFNYLEPGARLLIGKDRKEP